MTTYLSKFAAASAIIPLTFLVTAETLAAATIIVNPGDNLKSAVETALGGDTVELTEGTHVAGNSSINVPDGVAIMADPVAPHGSVVVQGGNNSTGLTIFRSTGSGITISGLKFVPDPAAALGGRAVWVPFGGAGDLTFNDNIVEGFTDAVFALFQTSGKLEFRNNAVTIVDRDPANNTCDPNPPFNCLGGNAGLTIVFAEFDSVDTSGNSIHGPGRNVERFLAVVGIIVFNSENQVIGDIDIWNNAIHNFDIGIFSSGPLLNDSDIGENRLHSNGAGIQVGQIPDPDITIPTPACCTNIVKNRITGNDFGIIIDGNAEQTTILDNQIAGNREVAIFEVAGSTGTLIGDNLIRGKDTGVVPSIPPGKAFEPVTGPVGN